jgi:uncharacterized protein (DUF1697 family)
MSKYVALLRGINVGGNNLIKMTALKACFEYDVIFLKEPLSAAVAMKSVRTKQGVDQAYGGTGVLYFSRLISRASQSQLSRLVSQPVYQSITIRNWNTTTKLLSLLEGPAK